MLIAIDNFQKHYNNLEKIYYLPKLCGTFSPMQEEVARNTSQDMLTSIFNFMFNSNRATVDITNACKSNFETIISISSLLDIR